MYTGEVSWLGTKLFVDWLCVHYQWILSEKPANGQAKDAVEDLGPPVMIVHAAKPMLVISIHHQAFAGFIAKM
jgi:hypothetical protein